MTQAIYRRYRPQTFDQVIGQEQVTVPLKNALKSGRVNHAYLFSGPRGCGKTTSARIMARCLNCEQGPTDTPCEVCPSCVELSVNGSGSLDVVEIDAASHNGVDDARALREKAFFAPVRDRYKIFILDEAHMVTTQGFNALLKLVEEPPEHVKFIFATTEPEKVITTIRSRTHHYPFRLVAPQTLRNFLSKICELENIKYDNSVISLIVRAGAGSVRDSLSILDQIIAGSNNGVLDYETTRHLLGYTDTAMLDAIVESFASRDGAVVYELVEKIVDSGQDPRRFVEDLLQKIRDLILIYLSGVNAKAILSTYSDEQLSRMNKQAKTWGIENLNHAANSCVEALGEMVGATSARIHLELLCARIIIPSMNNLNTVNLQLSQNDYNQNDTRNDRVSITQNDTFISTYKTNQINDLNVENIKQQGNQNTTQNIHVNEVNVEQKIPETVLQDSNLSLESHPEDEEFNTFAKTKKPGEALAPATFGKPIVMPNSVPQNKAIPENKEATVIQKTDNEQEINNENVSQLNNNYSFPDMKDNSNNFEEKFEETSKPNSSIISNQIETVNENNSNSDTNNKKENIQSDLIRLRWDEILEKIKNDKKSTWTLISRNAQPGAYDGQTLQLHFDTQALAGMFSSGTHIQITIKAIYETLGLNVQIKPTDEKFVENQQGLTVQDQKKTEESNLNDNNGQTIDFVKPKLVEEAEKSFLEQSTFMTQNSQNQQNNTQINQNLTTRINQHQTQNEKTLNQQEQNSPTFTEKTFTKESYTPNSHITENSFEVQLQNIEEATQTQESEEDYYTDTQIVDSYVSDNTNFEEQFNTNTNQQIHNEIENTSILNSAPKVDTIANSNLNYNAESNTNQNSNPTVPQNENNNFDKTVDESINETPNNQTLEIETIQNILNAKIEN